MVTRSQFTRPIVVAGIVSLVAYSLVRVASPEVAVPSSEEMLEAARLMNQAVATVAGHRERSGTPINEALDPNRTGLIGPQHTPLFTTVGHLEAKRTTTAPDVAGLIVHLLKEAGVNAGDRVAIGASGSFPALMVASLAATEAMGLRPTIIFSLGASAYGATDVDFHLLDIYQLLQSDIEFTVVAEAVSLGGTDDIGAEFEPELRERLIAEIEASGFALVHEPDLRRNVATRMAIYEGAKTHARATGGASEQPGGSAEAGAIGDPDERIAAFINIGGSDANLGTSPLILELQPGLNTGLELPPEDQRGVVFEMAAQGVPVIHLLNIRGLSSRYGLPWDPAPLPEPGQAGLHDTRKSGGMGLWMIAIGYLGALAAVAWLGRGQARRAAGQTTPPAQPGLFNGS